MKKILEFIFFGNIFYALCVVAMTVESSLFQGFLINNLYYYIIAFCITIIYYTQSYQIIFTYPKKKSSVVLSQNKRLQWFRRNKKVLFYVQIILFVTACLAIYKIFFKEEIFLHIRYGHWVLLMILLMAAVFYYGNILFPQKNISLRRGLIKPFIIGLVWAGAVVLLPAITKEIFLGNVVFSLKTLFSFIDYFLFVSILAIVFDIKDYKDDYNAELKTFVVKLGKVKSLKLIVIPLCVVYSVFCLLMIIVLKLSIQHLFYHLTIVVCTLAIVYSIIQKKNILYYLIAIDGLMLLKAIMGIAVQNLF